MFLFEKNDAEVRRVPELVPCAPMLLLVLFEIRRLEWFPCLFLNDIVNIFLAVFVALILQDLRKKERQIKALVLRAATPALQVALMRDIMHPLHVHLSSS